MDPMDSSDSIAARENKLYTRASIFWGTLFGGPVAAGYFLGKNYLALGDAKRATRSFCIGILVTLAFAILIGIVPDYIQDRIPQSIIPFIYTVLALYYFQQKQGKLVVERLQTSATKQSAWKVVGVTILILTLSAIGTFAIALSLHHIFQSS